MSRADYRLCDVCDEKAFYDASLNYEHDKSGPTGLGYRLDYLGDWVVICEDCAKTHECVVVERVLTP